MFEPLRPYDQDIFRPKFLTVGAEKELKRLSLGGLGLSNLLFIDIRVY